MRRDIPGRRPGMQVRRQPIRRSSPRLLQNQMYALGVMLMCAFTTAALVFSPTAPARRLEVHGARFTGEALVRQLVGMDGNPNLFGLQTDRIAARLVRLPAVESARVEVRLPDTVDVTVVEREPRMVWVVGGVRYVSDSSGLLFGMVDQAGNPLPPAGLDLQPNASRGPSQTAGATAGEEPTVSAEPTASSTAKRATGTARRTTSTARPSASAGPSGKGGPSASPEDRSVPTPTQLPPPSILPVPTPDPDVASGPGALTLPTVYDRRAGDASLGLGDVVDPIALDAGFRLAGLAPADVGSTAATVDVVLDDVHGFTLAAPSRGWVAELGFYTETLRKVTVIPGQVRDLKSVLAWAGEDRVAWIWLMADISDSHLIDYLPK